MQQTKGNKAYSYIRISSKKQLDGYGIARQTAKAQAYADANGLDLDKELQDVGSGFHGEHVKFGELGGFLKLVKEKKIPVGSTLIVESLDRLSREDVLIAQRQFIDILLADITIVTLMDNQVYHKDRDFTQLIFSLTIMQTANEESSKKRFRQEDNIRKNKLAALEGKSVYNFAGVTWIDQIRVSGKEYRFELNDHANTVRKMYEMYDSGIGVHSIVRYLNENSYPIFKDGANKNKIWKDAAVRRILRDEAAIGTYHVLETVEGKRVLMGDPLVNYYPAAVNEELFWRVQRRHTDVSIPGRTGRKFSNLFATLTKCSQCNRPLRLVQSGGTFTGGRRDNLFMCRGRFERGLETCDSKPKSFPYDALEQAVLTHIDDFTLDVEISGGQNRKTDGIRQEIETAERKVADLSDRRAILVDTIEITKEREERREMSERASALRREIEGIKAKINENRQLVREIEDDSVEIKTVADMIKSEHLTWQTGTDDDVRESRAKVSLALRKFVSRITIYFSHRYAEVTIAGGLKRYHFDRSGTLQQVRDLTPYLRPQMPRYWIERSSDGRPLAVHPYQPKIIAWEEIKLAMLADGYDEQTIRFAKENFDRLKIEQAEAPKINPRLNDPAVIALKARRKAAIRS